MNNREIFSWNPVYNLVMEIKDKYTEMFYKAKFNKEKIDGKEYTCLEYWVNRLNIEKYNNIFKILQCNQFEDFILIRYASYSDIYSDDIDTTPEELWNFMDGFYRECRSIVIDVRNEEIVLAPFRKFMNAGETEEYSFDNIKKRIENASSIEITDKLDGSMQSARNYHGKVIMSGSQAINPDDSWRLQDGYTYLLNDINAFKMVIMNSSYTFIFEYISLKDSHVVKYTDEQQGLYLIGMRDVYSGEQLSYRMVREFAHRYNVKMTKIFDKTFDEAIEDTKRYKSNEKEGFVINVDGFMFKLKCDDYVQMHRILSKLSSVNLIIRNIADDKFDDMISKIPLAYHNRVYGIAGLVYKYIEKMNRNVNQYIEEAPKDSRKDFMIWVDKNVPREYNGYVKAKYLGKDVNFIKSNGSSPHYKRLGEMGYSIQDLNNLEK